MCGDHIRMIGRSVDDGSVEKYLQIPLVPAPGRSLQEGVKLLRTGQEFAGGTGAGLADTSRGNQDFGYLVDPDGMLVEFNSASQDNFWEHNHYWHEKPLCMANWYADHLGMRLPPARDAATGATTPRDRWDPCDVPIGEVGYPSFMPQGQLRIPIGNVRFANGGWAWYTRQCRSGRCGPGNDRPLVPSRGQVVDHVALSYPDLDAVIAHLKATGVPIENGPYSFGTSRAVMIKDPDGLSLELIESKQDPPGTL